MNEPSRPQPLDEALYAARGVRCRIVFNRSPVILRATLLCTHQLGSTEVETCMLPAAGNSAAGKFCGPKFYMPVKLERLPRLCYPETQCTGESAQPTMYDPAVRTVLGIVRQQPTDPWPLTATQLASS